MFGKRLRRVAIVAGLLACGDADPVGISPTIAVSLEVDPVVVAPGGTVRVTVRATPSGGARVRRIDLSSEGSMIVKEELALDAPEPTSASWTYRLPISPSVGTVVFRAGASGSGVESTATASLPVEDPIPPSLVSFSANPSDRVQVGDTVLVRFAATDDAGLARTRVSWSGVATGSDERAALGNRDVTRTVRIPISARAAVAAGLTIEVAASDRGANVTVVTLGPILTVDTVPPVVDGTLARAYPGASIEGDTIRINLSAEDRGSLRWLGYRLETPVGPVQDSVRVASERASASLWTVATDAWVGASNVTLFAVDGGGNRTESQAGELVVAPGVRRQAAALALTATVVDAAEDAPAGLLYMSQPDLQRIAVLDLEARQFRSPIPVDGKPHGLDLTLGGDSLLVALRSFRALGIVTVKTAGGPRLVDTADLPLEPGIYGEGPDNVRVMSNGKVMISVTFDGSGYGGQILEYDLVTGEAVQRSDAGYSGRVTQATPLVRSEDRHRLLALVDDACCPLLAMVYDAQSNAFGPLTGTISQSSPAVSSSATGSRFLLGNELYDRDLRRLAVFDRVQHPPGAATVLTSDGQEAYLGGPHGYLRVRTSDASILESVVLAFETPGAPQRMWLVASGRLLVVLQGAKVYIVDVS